MTPAANAALLAAPARHRIKAIRMPKGRVVVRVVVKAIIALLACLAAADLVGVVVCVLFDVAPLRHSSAALPYAIWFVLGIFSGLIAYNAAGAWASPKSEGDWTTLPDAGRTGNLVVGTSFATLFALAVLFYQLYWGRGVAGEYFVPDSAPHTMLFLASTAFAMAVARVTLMPKPGS
jgi:hypothetical protein